MDTSSPLLIPRALPRPRGLPCLRVPWPGLPSPSACPSPAPLPPEPQAVLPTLPLEPPPHGLRASSGLCPQLTPTNQCLPRRPTAPSTPCDKGRSLHELSPQGAASCSLTPTGGWSLSPEGSQAPGPRPQPLPGTGQRSLPWTTAFRLQSPATSFPSPGLPQPGLLKGTQMGALRPEPPLPGECAQDPRAPSGWAAPSLLQLNPHASCARQSWGGQAVVSNALPCPSFCQNTAPSPPPLPGSPRESRIENGSPSAQPGHLRDTCSPQRPRGCNSCVRCLCTPSTGIPNST